MHSDSWLGPEKAISHPLWGPDLLAVSPLAVGAGQQCSPRQSWLCAGVQGLMEEGEPFGGLTKTADTLLPPRPSLLLLGARASQNARGMEWGGPGSFPSPAVALKGQLPGQVSLVCTCPDLPAGGVGKHGNAEVFRVLGRGYNASGFTVCREFCGLGREMLEK